MRLILDKNPWLRGGIEVGWTGSCSLTYYEEEAAEGEGNNEGSKADKADAPDDIGRYVTLLDGAIVSSEAPLREQNAAILTSPAFCGEVHIGNGPGRPLLRATVVPCASNPEGRFGRAATRGTTRTSSSTQPVRLLLPGRHPCLHPSS